jgi:hypothetical protein
MKRTLLCSLLFLLIVACQKQGSESSPGDFLPFVKRQLRERMLPDDFARLDFTRAVLMKMDSVRLLRIGMLCATDGQAFVLLQIDHAGTVTQGRQVEVTGLPSDQLQGNILIRSLSGEELVRSSIADGFIKGLHPTRGSKPTLPYSQEDPYREMPEVIIVCSYVNNQPSFSPWISLTGMFGYGSGGGSNGGAPGSYYGPYSPSSGNGGYGGGSGGGTAEGMDEGEVIFVEYESQTASPAININEYLKCFDAIPDAGAVCSIEILTDIPVDNDPSKLFDWKNETPGHTFLQIKKQNGSATVQQNIGFYPSTNWKTIVTPAPVAGKFVDNEKHEFNASLKMNLTAAQLKEVIIKIQSLSRFIRYDIDEYNCTDFALEVFNATRVDKLEIPKYDIPNGVAPFGTSTPQGLYKKLEEMKANHHTESNNITTGILKGWVGISKGACK